MRHGRIAIGLVAGALASGLLITSASAASTTPVPPERSVAYGNPGDIAVFSSAAPQGTVYTAGSHADGGAKYTPVFERIRSNGKVMWRQELTGGNYSQVRSVTTDPTDGSLVSITTRTTTPGHVVEGVLVRITSDGKRVSLSTIAPDAGSPAGGGFYGGSVGFAGKQLIVTGLGGGTFGGVTPVGVQAVVRAYAGGTVAATRFLGTAYSVAPPAFAPNGDILIAYTNQQNALRVARLRPDLSVVWDAPAGAASTSSVNLAFSVGVTHDGKTIFVSGAATTAIYALRSSDGAALGTAPVSGQVFKIVPSRNGALLVGGITDKPFLGVTPQGGGDGFIAELRSNNTVVWGDVRTDATNDAYGDVIIDGNVAYVTGVSSASSNQMHDFLSTYRLNAASQRG